MGAEELRKTKLNRIKNLKKEIYRVFLLTYIEEKNYLNLNLLLEE